MIEVKKTVIFGPSNSAHCASPLPLSFVQENPALLLVDTILGLTLNAVELFIAIT
jgi:hypothetical protein